MNKVAIILCAFVTGSIASRAVVSSTGIQVLELEAPLAAKPDCCQTLAGSVIDCSEIINWIGGGGQLISAVNPDCPCTRLANRCGLFAFTPDFDYSLIEPSKSIVFDSVKRGYVSGDDILGSVYLSIEDGQRAYVNSVRIMHGRRGGKICKSLLYNAIVAMEEQQKTKFTSLALSFMAVPPRNGCFCYRKVAESLGFKEFTIEGETKVAADDTKTNTMDLCDGLESKSDKVLSKYLNGEWLWAARSV